MTDLGQSLLVSLPHPELRQDADERSDIFRGRSPSLARPPTRTQDDGESLRPSLSDSILGRGRIGALAAIVELAITRWARRNSSASSSSSSSSSTSRSQRARLRKRRSSVETLQTVQSEWDIAAQIKLIKAREEQRQIPREFILYSPPLLSAGQLLCEPMTRRITRTTSLSLVLTQLDSTLKSTLKPRRVQPQKRVFKGPAHVVCNDHTFIDGKPRDVLHPGIRENPIVVKSASRKPKAWFLDVASPTWEDLQAIGKLLHLHPLTLEDILQRNPREKLELFPKLGYYFISFRAIESQGSKDTGERNNVIHTLDDSSQDDGFIGAANVYMVVFKEGICSFHFTDVSEHIERVRNRIVLSEEAVNMSSDWIAHGILDSIVDSFFPLLKEIEKEVTAIDDLVFLDTNLVPPIQVEAQGQVADSLMLEKVHMKEDFQMPEKNAAQTGPVTPPFFSPRFTVLIVFQKFKRTTSGIWDSLAAPFTGLQPIATHFTLRRIARTRKLVTLLTRLLATKSEVIAQIRKRLLTSSQSGLGNRPRTNREEDVEVSIYLGNVQDHILTLQHSLAHYERMLNQCHPAYLSQLRTTAGTLRAGTDKAALYLTIVSIAGLCVQPLIGVLSLNVTVPQSPASFHAFGIVIVLCGFIIYGYACFVRWWWIQAKRRRGAVLSKALN